MIVEMRVNVVVYMAKLTDEEFYAVSLLQYAEISLYFMQNYIFVYLKRLHSIKNVILDKIYLA